MPATQQRDTAIEDTLMTVVGSTTSIICLMGRGIRVARASGKDPPRLALANAAPLGRRQTNLATPCLLLAGGVGV